MPFDFAPAPKATATDKRRAALVMYHAAALDPAADWRAVADALAACLPALKAAAPAPDLDAAPALEWASYTDAQRKGKGTLFQPGRRAVFTFADGEQITVSLIHRANLALPDWARAARCAVSFYKAKRARNFLRLVAGEVRKRGPYDTAGLPYGNQAESHAEEYANGCAVPAIISATDLGRNVSPDIERCNIETAAMREGPRYLAELLPFALATCDASGWADWAAAWQAAYCHTMAACQRDLDRRKADAPAPTWQADQSAMRDLMPLAQSLGSDWAYRLITCPDKAAWQAEALTALPLAA